MTMNKKDILWTKDTLAFFIDKAMLNDDEIFIMENRVKGMPVSAMAMNLHCSESTIHRNISNLKKRYDVVQKEYPDVLPIRKKSAKEEYMDSH